jgi:c(7)-type cytochrome triheme protein
MMKQYLMALSVVAVLFSFTGMALAVGSGKTVTFADGKEGKVIFDGTKHAAAKLACKDCHPAPFAMKKAAKITMADHVPGKFCGKCHDGKKAFDQKDCAKCHKK